MKSITTNKFLSELNVRIADINDLPVIVDIYNSSIPSRMSTADIHPVSITDKITWFQKHEPTSRPLWIFEENNHCIGWASLQDFYGRPAYQGTAEISVYLAKEFQNKGYGKKIVTYVMNQCNQLNIHSLLAFVFKQNIASIKLFTSAQFEEWGCLKEIAYMDETYSSLIILGRKINNHSFL
jgi:phosphinothricin acetyltransferase